MVRTFWLSMMMTIGTSALAAGQMTMAPGQLLNMDYQTLGQFGGQLQIFCAGEGRGPGGGDHGGPGRGGPGRGGPGPGRPGPRDCRSYRWSYIVYPANPSITTCTANGRSVGTPRDCHTDNTCMNQQAIENMCFLRCQSGEFNDQLNF